MYMPQSYDHTVTGRVIRRLRLEILLGSGNGAGNAPGTGNL